MISIRTFPLYEIKYIFAKMFDIVFCSLSQSLINEMGTVRVSVVRFLLLYYKMMFCDGDISSNSYNLFEMRNYIFCFFLLTPVIAVTSLKRGSAVAQW